MANPVKDLRYFFWRNGYLRWLELEFLIVTESNRGHNLCLSREFELAAGHELLNLHLWAFKHLHITLEEGGSNCFAQGVIQRLLGEEFRIGILCNQLERGMTLAEAINLGRLGELTQGNLASCLQFVCTNGNRGAYFGV